MISCIGNWYHKILISAARVLSEPPNDCCATMQEQMAVLQLSERRRRLFSLRMTFAPFAVSLLEYNKMICKVSILSTYIYIGGNIYIKCITTIIKNHQDVLFKTHVVQTAQSILNQSTSNNMATFLTLKRKKLWWMVWLTLSCWRTGPSWFSRKAGPDWTLSRVSAGWEEGHLQDLRPSSSQSWCLD